MESNMSQGLCQTESVRESNDVSRTYLLYPDFRGAMIAAVRLPPWNTNNATLQPLAEGFREVIIL